MRSLIFILFFVMSFSVLANIPKNFGTVIPGVYRGGIITQESEYKYLHDLGVNTIISLEYFHKEKEKYCEEFNFDCQRYGIFELPYSKINMYQLKKAYKATLFALSVNKKVYIHCYAGSDRAGTLSSVLIIRYETCNKSYDSDLLIKEIKDTLTKYKFHKKLYPSLYNEIIEWAKNPPEWICD